MSDSSSVQQTFKEMPAMSNETQQPSPELFFQTVNSYQRTAAIKAAVELDLFTAIAEGAQTARDIAARCEASERGVRILCDYRSEEHTSELQSRSDLVCRLLLEKKKPTKHCHIDDGLRAVRPQSTGERRSPGPPRSTLGPDRHYRSFDRFADLQHPCRPLCRRRR